ncbi:MAG TPA: hypothetical protein VEA59_01035 [Patescibacteria group bacterium]|nr:hypothetical protein [Patescibacteria group bacterium]
MQFFTVLRSLPKYLKRNWAFLALIFVISTNLATHYDTEIPVIVGVLVIITSIVWGTITATR